MGQHIYSQSEIAPTHPPTLSLSLSISLCLVRLWLPLFFFFFCKHLPNTAVESVECVDQQVTRRAEGWLLVSKHNCARPLQEQREQRVNHGVPSALLNPAPVTLQIYRNGGCRG